MSSSSVPRIVVRRALGVELRSLREAAGLTATRVAELLGWSQSKVSRVESARVRTPAADLIAYIAVLGVEGVERLRLEALAAEAAGPDGERESRLPRALTKRQEDFVAAEATAVSIRQYQPILIPGYLQTDAYATRVVQMAGGNDIPRALSQRVLRRKVLTSAGAPNYRILLMEQALLWSPVGNVEMVEQMRFLADLASRPNVTLNIVPLSIEQVAYIQHPVALYDYGGRVPADGLIETMTQEVRVVDEADVTRVAARFDRIALSALSHDDSLAYVIDRADVLLGRP